MRCAAMPRVLFAALAAACPMGAPVAVQSGLVLLQLAVFSANPTSAIAQSTAIGSVASKPVTSPIQTQFKAYKVHFLANGQEELELASSVSPGDVVEYAAQHRNVSQRRLLNVDFAIPVPWGTTLWQGSVQPAHGTIVLASANEKPSSKDAKRQDQARVIWRVERLDPGQRVELKLRVSIDADPTLAPVKSGHPLAPRMPELRRP